MVKFPDELLNRIQEFFFLPTKDHQNVVMQNLPQTNVPGRFFTVQMHVTFQEISDLCNQVDEFLNPIEPVLPLLEHFHLEDSKILLKFFLNQCSGKLVYELSAYSLNEILVSFEDKLRNILTDTAEYDDIVSIAKCLGKDGIDLIEKEVTIVAKYKAFQNYSTDESIQHFRNMLIFFQINDYINALCKFCNEFGLERCLEDEHFKGLRTILPNMKPKQRNSMSNFSAAVIEVKKHLGISAEKNEAHKFKFLKLFIPLMSETKALRNFLNENNFRGKGKDRFLDLLALVTQALQHEEYNAEVLNTLYAVYCLLVPLNNPDLSFQELMNEVSKLDSAKCLAQLQTVKSNIDLIRMWFSKAEVIMYYCISCCYQLVPIVLHRATLLLTL